MPTTQRRQLIQQQHIDSRIDDDPDDLVVGESDQIPSSYSCLLWLALAVVIVGCATVMVPEVPVSADGTQDPVLVQGRDVYAKRCANCHRHDGTGSRGPRVTGELMIETYPAIAAQVDIVANGKALMPAFADALTQAEIEAVTRFTREVL